MWRFPPEMTKKKINNAAHKKTGAAPEKNGNVKSQEVLHPRSPGTDRGRNTPACDIASPDIHGHPGNYFHQFFTLHPGERQHEKMQHFAFMCGIGADVF
jgi:hypothetical protein